jgi:SAM-dependent methyltransferase
MIVWPERFTAHPAPYSDCILTAIDEALPAAGVFLDPMCGSGRCFELERPGRVVVGGEIEREFAALHSKTMVADATRLPFGAGAFDGGFTSPAYPNRMAGDYTGPGWTKNPKGRRNYSLSKRWLARDERVVLHRHNTARYGVKRGIAEYWDLHLRIWGEVGRVVKPGGVFVLNAKDLPGMTVVDGHVEMLEAAGFAVEYRMPVFPPGYRYGANRHRVDHEEIVVMRRTHR